MTDLESLVKKIQEDYRKRGEELSDKEAMDAAFNLHGLVDILYDVSMRYVKMRKRLRKEPKGFVMENGASCCVCHNGFEAGKGWFDRYEQKCLLCQKAVEDGVIPGYVCMNDDSYYSMYDLNSKFKLKTQRVKKLIKENWFKARIVLDDSGRAHHYVFLKSENPQLAQAERFNPVWKSKERHSKKVNAHWAREQAAKLKEELRAVRKR